MKKYSVIDGHNDTLEKLFLKELGEDFDFFKQNQKGHLDLVRAKKGGLIGGFFAIYTPPPKSSKESDQYFGLKIYEKGYEKHRSPIDSAYAKEYTIKVLDFAHQLEKESQGKLVIADNLSKLHKAIEKDQLFMILHMEGAEAINENLSDLKLFYDKGIRSIGPVWSRSNVFGHGVPFIYPCSPDTGHGLTEAGKKLIKACNELKIITDLAHINEKGFWDVASISKMPLVVSHTGVNSLCPSSRNLTDKQIDRIAESNGIIGIIFESSMINTKSGFPDEKMPISEIVKHIDYIVKRTGEDHVGLGSDFDGAKLIKDLQDVSMLPKLIEELEKIGYSSKLIEKITHKNWLRVIENSWK